MTRHHPVVPIPQPAGGHTASGSGTSAAATAAPPREADPGVARPLPAGAPPAPDLRRRDLRRDLHGGQMRERSRQRGRPEHGVSALPRPDGADHRTGRRR
ncbi:MAG: Cyclic beta-1,2-glucan synthase [uncultured Thermomicrobiales bacterium]|uniref:Cyclic beta-1,2-glucan synthase n=1 Tax=uncultured Thermomicrobiales bacterium TaxID=1645740 RepID=A0A6J4VFJ7_9BACT|nr:MAG: Cyclic beta-1,2-glucan synthase [uncultured Thermomicrobiales bacterium]